MGTRNLTMVISDKKTKVAQYGQWDGYPSGVGLSLLSFLTNKELFDKFKNNLYKVRFLDKEGVDKSFMEDYDKNAPIWSNEPDNRTDEQKIWFKTFMTRDLAEEVLVNIGNSELPEILIDDSSDFAADSLFCEWAYVIDLDKGTFEVYQGFNKEALTETDRFYPLQESIKEREDKYYPVKLLASFDLNNLPNEMDFLSIDKEEETEDLPL